MLTVVFLCRPARYNNDQYAYMIVADGDSRRSKYVWGKIIHVIIVNTRTREMRFLALNCYRRLVSQVGGGTRSTWNHTNLSDLRKI